MEDLNKITLIIATKNRHQYLERIIDYYGHSGIRIIVADATKEKYVKNIPANITYYHYPEVPYCVKLNGVFDKINTPYALLCADDDFIIPKAISMCVNFLDKNPEYASAQGHYVFFHYSKGKLFYSPGYIASIGSDFNENKARDRINRFNRIDIQFYYCVHKTETLKEVFSFASNKLYSLNLLELLIGNSALIKGKHKVLPVFYSVREVIDRSTGRSPGLNAISVLPEFQEQYKAFFSKIVKLLSAQENITIDQASRFFKQSIQNHIQHNYKNNFPIKKSIVVLLNNKIIPLSIRKQFQHFLLIWQKKKQQRKINALINIGGFPFVDGSEKKELQQIESYILKYNINQ